MLLLKIIYRKMIKNKLLYAFLLSGLLILTILMSSIPMLTEGLLNRILLSDLEEYQTSTNQYPGNYSLSFKADNKALDRAYSKLKYNESSEKNQGILSVYKKRREEIKTLIDISKKNVTENFNIKATSKIVSYSLEGRYIREDDKSNPSQFIYHGFSYLKSIVDFEKHINIIEGRLPGNSPEGNVFDIILTNKIKSKYQLELDSIYELTDVRTNGLKPIKVRPVGTFELQENDVFWTGTDLEILTSESLFINESVMERYFLTPDPCLVANVQINYAFDYRSFKITNINQFLYSCEKNDLLLLEKFKNMETRNNLKDIVKKYNDKKLRMEILLWTLYTPVILMLLLYLFMMSNAITELEKNEIAILNSRGATRFQVFIDYLIQSLILSFISMLIGPPVGRIMTSLIGSSNQFLKFENKEPLITHISTKSFVYGALASIIFIMIFTMSVFVNSKVNIVSHKRKQNRKNRRSIWQLLFIDILLLIVTIWGYGLFNKKMLQAFKSGSFAGKGEFEPILFIIPVLFILGSFMLFLRAYPYIIDLVYSNWKKRWKPNWYATFLQVKRSIINYHFIMIFLVVTISIGLFSSISIRSLNTNSTERILYKNGTDIVLKYSWDVIPTSDNNEGEEESDYDENYRPKYLEPDFNKYLDLEGISGVTRVFRERGCNINHNLSVTKNVDVMGIDPDSFVMSSWFKNTLLPDDILSYNQRLIKQTNGCIISTSLSNASGAKKGDTFEFNLMNEKPIKLVVLDIVNYWPTFNPNKLSISYNSLQKLIIINLSILQESYGIRPYEVWLKLDGKISSDMIIKQIERNKILYTSLRNSEKEIEKAMTDPYQTAINGAFSFGFIICGIICIMGFLIFWGLELKSRTIQYGVFRAVGLYSNDILKLLLCEQLLTSGVAFLAGVIIGIATSIIFVPFFQIGYNVSQMVPPFEIVVLSSDIIRIIIISSISVMLLFTAIIILIQRFKIDKALKLGED